MSVVELSKVCKSYGALQVVKDVSFSVEKGQVVALLGRSGSGKSTLLRCINGLEQFQSGEIIVAGHQVKPEPRALSALRRDVGIVFQSYNLFPHLTVERNITLALELVHKLGKAERQERARDVLARVGLSEKIHAYPEQLSGGQQQRVAIARSLATSPKVMLFDEVTSALDPELTGEVLKVLDDLAQGGMTMIIVTHEMEFARRLADRVIFMHEGRIRESGAPQEIMSAPSTPEFATFLGQIGK
jgi:polar amino acid transport system ATP-binding protein